MTHPCFSANRCVATELKYPNNDMSLVYMTGGCLPMRRIRCAAAVTQPVALGVKVISFLKGM